MRQRLIGTHISVAAEIKQIFVLLKKKKTHIVDKNTRSRGVPYERFPLYVDIVRVEILVQQNN